MVGNRLQGKRAASLILGFFLCVGLLLPAALASAAEITALSVHNHTTGGWGSFTGLTTGYTDTNGWLFPQYHPQGQNQYLSSIAGDHTALGFDTRFAAVLTTESTFTPTCGIDVNLSFEVEAVIDAASDEYWELDLEMLRSGSLRATYTSLAGYSIEQGTTTVRINHGDVALDSGSLVGPVAGFGGMANVEIDYEPVYTIPENPYQSPTLDWYPAPPATGVVSGTGPATFTLIYELPVSVWSRNVIPGTFTRNEAAIKLGMNDTFGNHTLANYPDNATRDADGIFVSAILVDVDGDGVPADIDNCPNFANPAQGDDCLPPPVGSGAEILGMTVRNRTTGAWGNAYAPNPDYVRFGTNYRDEDNFLTLVDQPDGLNQYRSDIEIVDVTPSSFDTRFTALSASEPFLAGYSLLMPRFAFEVEMMIGADPGEYWEMSIEAIRKAGSAVNHNANGWVTTGEATPTFSLNMTSIGVIARDDLVLDERYRINETNHIINQTETGVVTGTGPGMLRIAYYFEVHTSGYGWLPLSLNPGEASFRMGLGDTIGAIAIGNYPGVGGRDHTLDGFFLKGEMLDTDLDDDGELNHLDNCPLDPNSDQADLDEDGVGDLCDNCIDVENGDQGDQDLDDVGNACDLCSGEVRTWEVVYELPFDNTNKQVITVTPMGLGDAQPPIGPGQLVFHFKDDGTGMAIGDGPATLVSYDMIASFTINTLGTLVVTNLVVDAGPAGGTLEGNSLHWDSLFQNYHVEGYVTCSGGGCSLASPAIPSYDAINYTCDLPFVTHTAINAPAYLVTASEPITLEFSDINAGPGVSTLKFGTVPGALNPETLGLPNPACPEGGRPEMDQAINYIFWSGTEVSRSLLPPSGIDDLDNDGVVCEDEVGSLLDNCPEIYNPGQEDINGDGWGDLCQPDDPDGDGLPTSEDICPDDADPGQEETDGDGVGDACDVCPNFYDPLQADVNGDGIGDLCTRRDADGDGWTNSLDNCPNNENPGQEDWDEDGVGDACDPDVNVCGDFGGDTDLDGVCDDDDLCIDVPDASNADTNNDGIGDVCQCGDVDGSGWVDSADAGFIHRASSGLFVPPFVDLALCDVDGSGACDSADAAFVHRRSLGLFTPPFVRDECAPGEFVLP